MASDTTAAQAVQSVVNLHIAEANACTALELLHAAWLLADHLGEDGDMNAYASALRTVISEGSDRIEKVREQIAKLRNDEVVQ